jgi:hypothetical protein
VTEDGCPGCGVDDLGVDLELTAQCGQVVQVGQPVSRLAQQDSGGAGVVGDDVSCPEPEVGEPRGPAVGASWRATNVSRWAIQSAS